MQENQNMPADAGEDASITFKSIINFLKLAWMRILIYILCALVAAGVVLLALRFIAGAHTSTYARIEYGYSGIEKGLAPDGSIFNKDDVRSAKVLKDAVEKSGLQSKIPSLDALRDKISITGVLTDEYILLRNLADSGDEKSIEELRNYKLYPTSFDVQISNISALGIGAGEAQALLNNITDVYRDYFKQTWVLQEYALDIYDLYKSNKSNFYDYADYYDTYTVRLDQIMSRLTELMNTSGGASYRSSKTKTSFADLASAKSILAQKYNNYISFVISAGVSKNISEAIDNLTKSIALADIDLTKARDDKTNLESQIKNYPYNTLIVSDGKGSTTEYREYPVEYHKLQQDLTSVNLQITTIEKQIAIYTDRKTAFENISDSALERDIAYADELLEFISGESVQFVLLVNDTIADYYQNKYGSDAVRTAQPAVSITSTNMPTVIIIIVFVLAGTVTAIIVTMVKKSKIIKKKPVSASDKL